MNRPFAAALAEELSARSAAIPGPMPVADLARIACDAWQARQDPDPDADVAERRERATIAVIDAVYPRAAAVGRAAGAQAVADHITTAAASAAARLDDQTDPGRVVRGLLDRLTAAAQNEASLGTSADASGHRDTAMPRTYLGAFGDGRDRSDIQQAATATAVAWRHGYEDGWSEAYWSANRILNQVRNDEAAATTAVNGTPMLTWLDRLADSAYQIADDRGSSHPARLARLAGSDATVRASRPGLPSAADGPTRRNDAPHKGHRRPRGM